MNDHYITYIIDQIIGHMLLQFNDDLRTTPTLNPDMDTEEREERERERWADEQADHIYWDDY